jgi:hypothetical protein
MIELAKQSLVRRVGAAALALVAVALVVAACGGGGSSSSSDGAAVDKGEAPAYHKFAVESRDVVTSGGDEAETSAASDRTGGAPDVASVDPGVNAIEVAKFPNGKDNDEISPTGAKPVKPCNLVTKAQASGILGGKVAVSERPQGPTCVYTGSGREVTLVVMETSLRSLREGARHSTKVRIGSHTGYCLRYQATSVVVAVPKHRVLQVTGPCQAGVRFAAVALRHFY